MGALDGRVAVITGAGRGIGREHALLFAKEGAQIVVNDLGGSNAGDGADSGPAHEVVDEIVAVGGAAVANTENISTWSGAESAVQQAIDVFGRLDVLVNNAGILRDSFIAGMEEAHWDTVIAVHLKGHFAMLRHAAGYWKAQSKSGEQPIAAVINTASGSGVTLPNAGQANYGSAKAGIAALTLIAAWAITEPDSGSDAFGGMKTTVRRSGDEDGAYLLNGQKTFITNGPYADVLVVYAKIDDGSVDRRHRPVLPFVLDAGMPGLVQGKPFKKMGMMSSPTGELFFDDVRLTPDRLLGETEQHSGGDGRESARANFAAERLGVALMALGIINECHRLCLDYAKTRILWGRNIGQFQLVQLKLAKMEVARINVQNMVFQTLEKAQAGKVPSLAEASAIKLYSSEAATDVAMEAVQLFGGNGYMAEYRVEQLARDAKSLMIYAGSNEVQVTHIAKGLLAG